MDAIGLQVGFRSMAATFGIEDRNSPARIYARRAAELMRAHGSALRDLPSEALSELEALVKDDRPETKVPQPSSRPTVRRSHEAKVHNVLEPGPLEVLDMIVVPHGETVVFLRQQLAAEYPAASVIQACNVIRWFLEAIRKDGTGDKNSDSVGSP